MADELRAIYSEPEVDHSPACPRCDGNMEWIECSECGGEGGSDAYEMSPVEYSPGEIIPCGLCWGKGGRWGCWNSATFSPCRTWRYLLTREWDPSKPQVDFICLNPSTADETVNDPTVTRLINFARTWGFGSVAVTNLFALRSTDPKVLYVAEDPVGPDNDRYLLETARSAGLVVAAWGNHGALHGRSRQVADMLSEAGVWLQCFGLTMNNEPRHPLYLAADTKTEPLDG